MVVKKIILGLLLVISCYLLLLEPTSSIRTYVLIVSSIALLFEPLSFIPLLLTTSISSSIAVIPGIAGFYYYSYMFLIGCMLKYSLVIGKKTHRLCLILYLLCLLISANSSISQDYEFTIRMLVACVPILVIPNIAVNNDSQKILQYTLIGAIFVTIIVALKLLFEPVLYVPGDDMISPYSDIDNFQITISESINPNTVAQSLLLCYVIMFIYGINTNKWQIYALSVLPVIPMLIIGSRTVFIALLSITILFFMWKANLKIATKFIIAIFLIIFCNIILDWFATFNDRLLLEMISEDRGSGRFDTWERLFNNVIPNHLMTGIGFGRVNLDLIGYDVDADNMYVDSLCQIGLLGSISLMLMILSLIKVSVKQKSILSQIAFAMLMFVLIVGAGETVFDTFIFVFIILYTTIVAQCSMSSIKNQ